MMGLPNWLRGREEDYDMTQDDEVHVPPIAEVATTIKKPLPFHIAPVEKTSDDDDHAAAVVSQAHGYIEQWKIDRANQQKVIELLQGENAELREEIKKEVRKSGLLELDLAQAANTIQTMQSEIGERRHFASMIFEINQRTAKVLERFGTHPLPKKERHAKATKAKRQAPSRAVAEDRPIPDAGT